MAESGGVFPYKNKKKDEVNRWHVRFPGKGAKDYVASVAKEEREFADKLLAFLRESDLQLDNQELRKVCQVQLKRFRSGAPSQASASVQPLRETEEETGESSKQAGDDSAIRESVGRGDAADQVPLHDLPKKRRRQVVDAGGERADDIAIPCDTKEKRTPVLDSCPLRELLPESRRQPLSQAQPLRPPAAQSSAPAPSAPSSESADDTESPATSGPSASRPSTLSMSSERLPPGDSGPSAADAPDAEQPAPLPSSERPSADSAACSEPAAVSIELDCEVCFNEFNDSDRAPYLSKCGHTFCGTCVKKIIGSREKYDCPVCRQTIGAHECMKNIWIIQRLDALLRQRPRGAAAASSSKVSAQPAETLADLVPAQPRRAKRRRVSEPGFQDPSREPRQPREPRPQRVRPQPEPVASPPQPKAEPAPAQGPPRLPARPLGLRGATRGFQARTRAAQHEISVAVPDNLMGKVMGPGGAVIQAIQRTYSVKANAVDKVVRILGERQAVETCAIALQSYVERNCDKTELIPVASIVAGAVWPVDLRAVERAACEEAKVKEEEEVCIVRKPWLRVELDKETDPPHFRLKGTGAAVAAGAAKLTERLSTVLVHEVEVPINQQVGDVNDLVKYLRSMSGKRGICVEPCSEVLEMSEAWMEANELSSQRALKVSLAGQDPECTRRRDEIFEAARNFRMNSWQAPQPWSGSWWTPHQRWWR